MTFSGIESGQGWQTRRLLHTPRDNRFAAYLLGAALLGISTWWPLGQGGFFGTVWLPGAVLLYLALALMIALARLPIGVRGPHALAAVALFGLAAWTAISIIWTPAQDLAFDYAQRSFVYAAAFTIGLMFTVALRGRMRLSVLPILAAGTIVTIVVLIRIWSANDIGSLIDLDGTLDYPLGYRNANAGFFAMIAFAAIAFGAQPGARRPTRITTSALAATALSLGVVSQSRGSLIAVGAGALTLLAVAPDRPRSALTLVISSLPVALLFSQLLDPYEAATAGSGSALGELQQAATAAAVAGLAAGLLSAAWTILEARGAAERLPRLTKRGRAIGWGLAALAVLAAVVGFARGPVGDGVDAIVSGDTQSGAIEGSRFSYGGGLNRTDFWRVAVDQATDDPVIGGGAGSFRSDYLLARDSAEMPRNAHSVWLETAGELGLVGLALLIVAFAAAVAASLRSRRLGPESATLSTVALTVFAVWLGQASVDWSWYFAGLTVPVFALLGSAAAPAALSFEILPSRIRSVIGIAAVLLALIAVPTYLSERLTLNAAAGWREDLPGAYQALSNAADLNPFADVPLLVEAEIAGQSGDDQRALDALDRAQRRESDDWRTYLAAARILSRSSPSEARAQLDHALALNPKSAQALKLQDKLERREAP